MATAKLSSATTTTTNQIITEPANATQTSASNQQKAQKGWLSRWTRKQWSRHWFVLKSGSLTYYRGPAAELCSFLDGVLDLSLIKQIEVQQSDIVHPSANQLQQQQQHHHHHLYNHHTNNHHLGATNHQTNSNNVAQQQFTFLLKMWNGECHQLAASSAAERQLWLAAINASTNGVCLDDEANSDSASSSDSSPTSNLSAKSADIGRLSTLSNHYQVNYKKNANSNNNNEPVNSIEQQQQFSLNQLAFTIKSAIRRREEDVLLDLNSSSTQIGVESVARPTAHKENENANQNENENKIQKEKQSRTGAPKRDYDLVERHWLAKQRIELAHSEAAQTNLAQQNNKASRKLEEPASARVVAKPTSSITLKALAGSNQDNTNDGRNVKDSSQEERQTNEFELQPQYSSQICHKQAQLKQVAKDKENRPVGQVEEVEEVEEEKNEDEFEDDKQKGMEESERKFHRLLVCLDADDEDNSSLSANSNQQAAAGSLAYLQVCSENSFSRQACRLFESNLFDECEQISANSANGSLEEADIHRGKVDELMSSVGGASRESPGKEPTKGSQVKPLESAISELVAGEEASLERMQEEEEEKQQQQQQGKQKKRVTFDLSRSSQHQLTSSSESESSAEDSDDSSLSSSSSVSSSASFSEDELCGLAAVTPTPAGELRDLQTGGQLEAPATDGAQSESLAEGGGGSSSSDYAENANQLLLAGRSTARLMEAAKVHDEHHLKLAEKLESAEGNIEELEIKLGNSFASYNKLEMSYKRLQGDFLKCDELHRDELARMQSRVEELTKELDASELKLAEAREKLLRYEEHLERCAGQQVKPSQPAADAHKSQPAPLHHHLHHQHHHHQRAPVAKALNSWLRASQHQQLFNQADKYPSPAHNHNQLQQQQQQKQQVVGQHNPPLLLTMHHVKQTLAANQQSLGLKLLNHSKQIQRRLNELELKVDKIQSTTTTIASNNNAKTSARPEAILSAGLEEAQSATI